MNTKNHEATRAISLRRLLFSLLSLSPCQLTLAQDGNAGISEATTMIRGYFDTGVLLMYAIGAIVGITGAIKVYNKWVHGDHDTGKVAVAWFTACIFLVVVVPALRSFFGL